MINPKIRGLEASIKKIVEQRLTSIAEKNRFNESRPLCGMVTYKGWIDRNRRPVFQKFHNSIKDTALTALVDSIFCPVEAGAMEQSLADSMTFILPMAISVGPPNYQGTYYAPPNQLMPIEPFVPPKMPKF